KQVKLSSPDYRGRGQEEAVADFLRRIQCYEATYEPLDEQLDSELSSIKIFKVGLSYLANRLQGHVQSRVGCYLGCHSPFGGVSLCPLGSAGTAQKTAGKLPSGGGVATPDPSPRPSQYAQALSQFIQSQSIRDLKVWTSHLKRTIQTAEALGVPYEQWKALNEIDA
ncbi:F26L bisphosphatase, partial [Alcedo cyanopectus]|nr:F26L bisphosphatase [Ceyx cyanopectus]